MKIKKDLAIELKDQKKKRIGTLEFRLCSYLCDYPEVPGWEIVKYYPNCYYGKEDGYIYVGAGRYQDKEWPNHYVSESCFRHKESCYTIASWHWDDREHIYELRSIGNRLLDLTEEERTIFWQIYEYGEKFINAVSEDDEYDD